MADLDLYTTFWSYANYIRIFNYFESMCVNLTILQYIFKYNTFSENIKHL